MDMYLTEEEKTIIELYGGNPAEAITDDVMERMQSAAENEDDPDMKETLVTLIEKF